MKRINILLIIVFSTYSTFASELSPMNDYKTTIHSKSQLNTFWRTIKTMASQMRGKDCFKRAHIWSYKLEKDYKVKSKKIFMHYTWKFNHELDNQGKTGVSRRLNRITSRNMGWDFHVAPAVNIEGVDMVLDGTLKTKPLTVEQWVDSLMTRGVNLLKRRQASLVKDLEKYKKRLSRNSGSYDSYIKNKEKIKEIQDKLKYLGVSENLKDKIEIKCKKIEHISQFDREQDNQWCHYQEASMYYYGPLQLRYLNYGQLPLDQRLPVTNLEYHTDSYFRSGHNYVYRNWDYSQLDESLGEFKVSNRIDSIYDL